MEEGGSTKGFYYDTLLDEENLCNLGRKKNLIQRGIGSGKKLVVYGPRNFGKTSLVKNIVIPSFRRKHPKSFVLFADLMEVKSLESIHQRLQTSFERSFQERFSPRHLKIGLDQAILLQDTLFRVPESINIVCAHLYEHYQNKTFDAPDLYRAIEQVVEGRRSRYEEWLSHFSEKEEEILVSLAKSGPVKQPTGRSFMKKLNTTPRTASLALAHFMDRSVVEKTNEGYRIADPLFHHFLRQFR